MYFDDYDDHIVQKYRLAVSIAIIKNTPDNCTPKTYLERLRRVLTEKMDYDSDITICEDDFDFNNDENDNKKPNDKDNEINDKIDDIAIIGSDTNNSQLNDSVTILKDFNFNEMMINIGNNNDTGLPENNSISDVLKILKGVDNGEMLETEITCSGNINHSQSTYYESSQSQINQINCCMKEDNCLTQKHRHDNVNELQYDNRNCNNDLFNQRTINVDTKENVNNNNDDQIMHNVDDNTDNYTHVSQSQLDYIVLPKYLLERQKLKDNQGVPNDTQPNKKVISNKTTEKSNLKQIIGKSHDKVEINTVNKVTKSKITGNKKHGSSTQCEERQAKRLKNRDDRLNANTDNNVGYINEIKNNLKFKANYFDFNLNYNSLPTNGTSNEFVNSDHVKTTEDSLLNLKENKTNVIKKRNDKEIENKNSSNNFVTQNSFSNEETFNFGYNSQTKSQFSQEFDFVLTNLTLSVNPKVNSININKEIVEENTAEENTLEENVVEEKTVEENANVENAEEESINGHEDNILEEMYEQLTDSQIEAVPFKVLEELNRIKAYLAKRDGRNSSGCVSDSGYKSDSQSRSSFKSALHCSNAWLNQSAHCLLTFLRQSPLIISTEDITNEISRTLGKLIDKLHEEEKYPSFLEEVLLAVDDLLKEIYEEEAEANQLLKKEEELHRLFLLNKSSHIIKYTTEKIITTLEDVLKIITDEELIEITHTYRTENLSYIFHILETLLKKLIVYKNLSQSSTQNSQEDEGSLKKSSLTDIWRKKWNPAKKTEEDALSSVKQCVLKRASDILNKIIVQAIDGYSLISYFALQCFNLLQN